MARRAAILAVISFFLISLAPVQGWAFRVSAGSASFVPEPRLIYPGSSKVVLKGKKTLDFKWSPHEGMRSLRKYYDFRLYKGYNMVEANLLFKKRVPPGEHTAEVSADLFENGKIYTWSLRQRYRNRGKSARSYQSFKIVK